MVDLLDLSLMGTPSGRSLVSLAIAALLLVGVSSPVRTQVTSTARTTQFGWLATAATGTPVSLPGGQPLPSGQITSIELAGAPTCIPSAPGPNGALSSGSVEYTATTFRFAALAEAYQPVTRAGPGGCVGGAPVGEFSGGAVWSLSSATPISGVLRGAVSNPFTDFNFVRSTVSVEILDLRSGVRWIPDPVGPVSAFEFSFDAYDRWTFEWPVELDSQPTEFEITVSVRAETFSPWGGAQATGLCTVDLEFDATAPRPITEFGSSCGPDFTGFVYRVLERNGNPGQQTLSLAATGAAASSAGAFVFGVNTLSVPLPLTNCLLLIDPVVVLPAAPGLGADFALEIAVPSGLSGFSARGQFLGANVNPAGVDFVTSEGFSIQL